MNDGLHSIIEGLGTYLPTHRKTTEEVLTGCNTPIRFPLEKVTGIHERAWAGDEEYSIDLAEKAIKICFERSVYRPEDIDLLICCNISRVDGAGMLTFEPCTAIRLREKLGLSRAMAFDITNACAGIFTGIYLVDTLIKNGTIRRGMVVSGEYITHLAQSAQREIEGFMDPRLACLTLGDAGAAIIMEGTEESHLGFQQIELQTYGRYSPYCIAGASEKGGWIMHTDSVNLTNVALKASTEHSLQMLKQADWYPGGFDHLIMHQTSRMSLNSAVQEINQRCGQTILHEGNTINNLLLRGNTASTSHLLAIEDQIKQGRINRGDKVVFGISASGLTVGTALYVFDDLPERLRGENPPKLKSGHEPIEALQTKPLLGLRVEQAAIASAEQMKTEDPLDVLTKTAMQCLDASVWSINDIGLLIFCGVYRKDYLMEPAYAAMLAGKLNMNDAYNGNNNDKTLAFDVFNGPVGFMNACFLAQQMISAGKCRAAMIVASEVENNAVKFPDELFGLQETATALIVDAHPETGHGFSPMITEYQTQWLHALHTYSLSEENGHRLVVKREDDVEEKYLVCLQKLVASVLQKEGLHREEIDLVFAQQISTAFLEKLSSALQIDFSKFINVVEHGLDLYTSSIPSSFHHAIKKGLCASGSKALVLSVGSGVQAMGAVYYY